MTPAMRKIKGIVDNAVSEKDIEEGYSVLPSYDRERYTEIDGLEGPFVLQSGKVVYYDPYEGKYYDRDTDMYMSDDEYFAHAKPNRHSIEESLAQKYKKR